MTDGEATRLSRIRRARAAGVLLIVVMVVLAGAFFRLQVQGGGAYELQSRNNRLRPIPIPAAGPV